VLLNDQVSLVAGAGRGVGRAVCLALARLGSHVGALGIHADNLAETAAAVEALGRRALVVCCDISDEDQVEAAIERTVRELGRLDIVVNSAVWMDPPGSLVQMPRAVWEKTIAVDLTGAFFLSKHALKVMLPQNSGRLIHISSAGGKIGSARRGAYAAAKAGVINLVQSLALEADGTSVRVNAVCPFGIAGEHNKIMRRMFADLRGAPHESDEDYERASATMMQPEDVAELVAFLASPAAHRLQGQAIVIGQSALRPMADDRTSPLPTKSARA
jgi:NAD(P)-dependent dehydrogenase (short-subunit alcohol dehydrogenase family)